MGVTFQVTAGFRGLGEKPGLLVLLLVSLPLWPSRLPATAPAHTTQQIRGKQVAGDHHSWRGRASVVQGTCRGGGASWMDHCWVAGSLLGSRDCRALTSSWKLFGEAQP